MTIHYRHYTAEPGFTQDFHAVRDFLVRINRKNPIRYNFEWGRWEWAFSLPHLDTSNLSKIGLWEDDGAIVALVTYEEKLGHAYICLDPQYESLQRELFLYARDTLSDEDGKLEILINNAARALQRIAARHGFKPTQHAEGSAVYDIEADRITYALPPGYGVTSLAESCDLVKFHRLLWRGFNHEGDPPVTDQMIEMRRKSLSGPHVNPELNILVVSPQGEYVSYCGMWYDKATEYALVEPVATDPAHRRLGLGRAAVLEAIKRCGQLGAKQAYVGSSQQFYYQIGFHPLPAGTFWEAR